MQRRKGEELCLFLRKGTKVWGILQLPGAGARHGAVGPGDPAGSEAWRAGRCGDSGSGQARAGG